MKIFVIIVSYNFEQWMDRCLGSLRNSSIPVGVIVVDNCSQDNTIDLIKQNYPEVVLIENYTNEGFGRANNKGLDFAVKNHGDFVFLLNQDAWIDTDVIETLLKTFKDHPEYGILSPVHLTGTGDALDPAFANYSKLKNLENLISLKDKQPVKVNMINAAFWMIPNDILQKIGGFSPIFYHYGEDIDYVNRLHYHGYNIGFCSNVFGYHYRENRNPMKESLVFQLTEYSNINYSFFKAFGYGILAAFKKAFIAFYKEGVNEFVRLFSISIKLLIQSRLVIQVREKTKRILNYIFIFE